MREISASVPVVLFTSDRHVFESAAADQRIRASGWLPKPFDLTQLAQLLLRFAAA